MNYIGETDNTDRFRRLTGGTTVTDAQGVVRATKLKAESVVYQSLSASYMFENCLTALIGVANLTDEQPPRMTSWRTSNEVDIVGQYAFYSQDDWLGRRFFVNVKLEF